MSDLTTIIMAAGKGTRMKSAKPKVLQTLAGKPLLDYVLTAANAIHSQKNLVVYGFEGEQVKQAFADEAWQIDWVHQAEQLGTGHAVMMTLEKLPKDGKSLILSGDVPLIGVDTLQHLTTTKSRFAMLTMQLDNPFGLGRIIRQDGKVTAIVEEKDANDSQRQVTEINSGVYCVANEILHKYLNNLTNDNAQGEYYLTDIVKMAVDDGIEIATVSPTHPFEIEGVNDRSQLAKLERTWQTHQANELMKQGVHLIDPSRFDYAVMSQLVKMSKLTSMSSLKGTARLAITSPLAQGVLSKIAKLPVVQWYSLTVYLTMRWWVKITKLDLLPVCAPMQSPPMTCISVTLLSLKTPKWQQAPKPITWHT